MTGPAGGATPPAGGAPAGDPPPAPAAGGAPAAPAGGTPATDGYPEGLGDAGKRALDAEREARRTAERLLGEQGAELKKLQDAQKTDAEKQVERIAQLERDNAALLAQGQQARVAAAATSAARAAGFWDPDLALALIDTALVKYDAAGNPTNVDALVAAVAKAKPRLVNGGAGAPDYGAGHRGDPPAGTGAETMNDRLRRAAGRIP